MKVYPLTNRILPNNDAKAEVINAETRQLFEVANGGLDEANIEAGNDSSGGTGLDNNKFDETAWHQYFTGGADLNDSTKVNFTLPAANENNVFFRHHTQKHLSVSDPIEPGWVTGQYQVSFQIAMLEGNTNGLIPYSSDAFETANRS